MYICEGVCTNKEPKERIKFYVDVLLKYIRIFNGCKVLYDWKFCHEGNCSASRGLPSDAEQLPEGRNFQYAPKNHFGFFFLHTLPSTIAFRLKYMLFYQFYAKITTFFEQEKFGTALLLYVDVEMFGGNWRENDVKNDVKSQNRHTDVMHESHLSHLM